MYFKNRSEAGKKLALELASHRYDNCVVLALSDGGVLVGAEIAHDLHCIITMLLTERIAVPGEDVLLGTVDQAGGFLYNQTFSEGQIEDYYGEYHGYLDDQKREKFGVINRLLGDGGMMDEDMLRDLTVILVSDGLVDEADLDAAAEFLKPVRIGCLIVATPIASVSAVDRMHVLADELHVLNVTDNYIATDHYYDDNVIPSHEQTIKNINATVMQWR